MTKLGNSTLFGLIHDYLKLYLPKQRKLSPNTIRSYREALELFVDFLKDEHKIPLQDVTFEMFTADKILAFLDHLEAVRGCTVSTRNNRLSIIKAFLSYAVDRDVTTVVIQNELRKVPVKKSNVIESVEYMSMAAVSAILAQPNAATPKGLRDRFFMMLLYDTGARVQEMIDITLKDIRINKTSTITLHGKGSKTRSVPLMEKTVEHLQRYLSIFHQAPYNGNDKLFYTVSHKNRNPMSASCIRLFIGQYGKAAKKECIEVPDNVHPHLWRHSRAMHLYQQGMNLILVSEWLGHANLETTQIYAHADTEHKRKAIAAATPQDSPLQVQLAPERFTISDDDTLKRLTGLR
jgi:site-specific recombinase XerD